MPTCPVSASAAWVGIDTFVVLALLAALIFMFWSRGGTVTSDNNAANSGASRGCVPGRPEDCAEILEQWGGPRSYRSDLDSLPTRCVHALIEAQCQSTPESIALVSEACTHPQLRYLELWSYSTRLAVLIKKAGVKPGGLVGVLATSSTEGVVGIISVLRAGAGYVPMCPTDPVNRLQHMVQDSGMKVIMAGKALVDMVSEELGVQAISLVLAQSQNVNISSNSWDIASHMCCLYTSASSGKPKGVVLSHAAVLSHLSYVAERCALDSTDCCLASASHTSVCSLSQIFNPLLVGGTVILPPAGATAASDMAALSSCLGEYQVTRLQLFPAALKVFLQTEALPASLKWLLVSGEVLSTKLARKAVAGTHATILNLYGCTESAGTITSFTIHSKRIARTRSVTVPIGQVVKFRVCAVLDRNQQPLAIRAPGELHCAGVGLCSGGYLKSSELSDKRFPRLPLYSQMCCGEDTMAWYRTGDRVCWTQDGVLEFLGRVDYQIKLHGVRIEPWEIEKLIMGATAAERAIVQCHKHELVAFVSPGGSTDTEQVQQLCREELPHHMMPATVVPVDTWPLTAKGKVDRSELASIAIAGPIERMSLTVLEEESVQEFVHGQQAHELLEHGMDSLGLVELYNKLHTDELKRGNTLRAIWTCGILFDVWYRCVGTYNSENGYHCQIVLNCAHPWLDVIARQVGNTQAWAGLVCAAGYVDHGREAPEALGLRELGLVLLFWLIQQPLPVLYNALFSETTATPAAPWGASCAALLVRTLLFARVLVVLSGAVSKNLSPKLLRTWRQVLVIATLGVSTLAPAHGLGFPEDYEQGHGCGHRVLPKLLLVTARCTLISRWELFLVGCYVASFYFGRSLVSSLAHPRPEHCSPVVLKSLLFAIYTALFLLKSLYLPHDRSITEKLDPQSGLAEWGFSAMCSLLFPLLLGGVLPSKGLPGLAKLGESSTGILVLGHYLALYLGESLGAAFASVPNLGPISTVLQLVLMFALPLGFGLVVHCCLGDVFRVLDACPGWIEEYVREGASRGRSTNASTATEMVPIKTPKEQGTSSDKSSTSYGTLELEPPRNK